MEDVRIVLVDDQTLFAESLKTVIDLTARDIRVVGVAANGKEAIELVSKLQPDIVLMDVRMPGMDGVEATEKINRNFPDIKIIMLTTFDDDEYVFEALRKGASGYLLKRITADDLITSIRAIKKGNILLSPSAAKKLTKQADMADRKQPEHIEIEVSSKNEWLKELSEREMEVLQLIAEGYDNKQISGKLYLSLQTVKNYVYYIYSKSGIHDRIRLMKTIQEQGIFS